MGTNKKCLMAITGAFEADGGIAAVNRLVIRGFAEEGYQVDIFSLSEQNGKLDYRYAAQAQINLKVFNNNKIKFTLAVWKALRKGGYSFVVADLVNIAAILAPTRILFGCKYIVWLFGTDVFPPRPDFEGRIGLKFAWKRLAISEYTRSNLINRFADSHIEVCQLALDPVRHFTELSIEPPMPTPGFELCAVDGSVQPIQSQLILHVGRMDAGEGYKGQDSLLQALPTVLEHFPEAQLVLAGQGSDMPRLQGIARSLPANIHSQIFMPGYIDQLTLDALYQQCYVFAMPSTGEGFGLVFLEAMSRAKPCLGGKVDATPCVVRDGETGVLVDDPTSPTMIADSLIYLFENPEQAHAMGVAGYNLVREYYLLTHFKRRFLQLINS